MPTIDTAVAREHAVVESVRMHYTHRELENKVLLAPCVRRVNSCMSPSLATLPAFQNLVQHSKCPNHGELQSHRYLYFQNMSTDSHSLNQKRKDKKRTHLPAQNLPMIEKEVAVKTTSRMAYVKTNLHRVPHGSDCLSTKLRADLLLDRMYVPYVTINHGGQTGVANLKYNPNAVRDSRGVGTSVKIRSLIWGVGKNQAVTFKNSRQYSGFADVCATEPSQLTSILVTSLIFGSERTEYLTTVTQWLAEGSWLS